MLLSDSSFVPGSLLGGVGVRCGAVEKLFMVAERLKEAVIIPNDAAECRQSVAVRHTTSLSEWWASDWDISKACARDAAADVVNFQDNDGAFGNELAAHLGVSAKCPLYESAQLRFTQYAFVQKTARHNPCRL